MNNYPVVSNRPLPFVLLSNGRSGTNFLISKLILTKKVIFGWEPFNKTFFGYGGVDNFPLSAELIAKLNDPLLCARHPESYINFSSGFTGELDGKGILASGFKIFPIQPHDEAVYWAMTKDARFNAIVLERKDTLAAYSSLLIALETNIWAENKKGASEIDRKQTKVFFDPIKYLEYKNFYQQTFIKTINNLQEHKVPHLKIYYEDLIFDPECYVTILKFLGLPLDSVEESWLSVQNDTNIINRFLNPDDVTSFLHSENKN